MDILLSVLLALVTLLWLSSFGYFLFLYLLTRFRKSTNIRSQKSQSLAVVIPTLNEAQWIDRKLDNLKESDYPADRMRVVVVDGGSEDGTLELIRKRISRGEAIRLISLARGSGKATQINRVFAELDEAIVIVTDADTALEPSCIGFLAGQLELEPRTGIVGAMVDPQTELIEEKVHWSLLNWIWWLEGEVWSSPGLSGVCYAMKRKAFSELMAGAKAEDVHLALNAAARGYRVRICPQAHVRELRVPRTLPDYLHYRRQRGQRYRAELSRTYLGRGVWQGWKIQQWVRYWQMTWLPRIALLVALLTAILLATPLWQWGLVVILWMTLSSLALLSGARKFMRPGKKKSGLVRWSWAGIRWGFLTLFALLFLPLPYFSKGRNDGGAP